MFLKAAFFGLCLFFASLSNFSILSVLFFATAAFVLYFRPSFVGSYYGRYAFIILLFISVLGMEIMAGSILFFPGIVLFSFVFYLILGVKEIFFIKRSRIYYIAALILFYSLFIIFFLADKSSFYFLKYSGAVIASFFLFREWLSIVSVFHFPRREFVAALAATFIITQLLWVVALLPIGFIAGANLMLLFVVMVCNFLFAHFTGKLLKDFLIQQVVLFLILSSLIFCCSYWLPKF